MNSLVSSYFTRKRIHRQGVPLCLILSKITKLMEDATFTAVRSLNLVNAK